MRDREQVTAGNPVPCPKCRRAISPESFDCSYCGAAVAAIWEDCRQGCYFLRIMAVLLLASVIITIVVVVTLDALHETGVAGKYLAVISAIIAATAIGLWKLSDTLNPPPEPYQEFRDGLYRAGPRPPHGEGASSSGSANGSGLSAG